MRSRLLLWTWLSALTHTPAGTALSHAPAALRAARRPRLASRRAVVPRMQEAADQPEPDAGLAASLRERREALAQDASLRARRDELERERAPPAVSLEPEHLEELLSELAALFYIPWRASRGAGDRLPMTSVLFTLRR